MRRLLLLVPLLVLLAAGSASAGSWYIAVGDCDGFGFNGVDGPDPVTNAGAPWSAPTGAPLQKAAGGPADTDADGKLEVQDTGGPVIACMITQGHTDPANPQEYLPDIDGDGVVRTESGDIWDNRDASELADTKITLKSGVVTDTGSTGSKWTDISIAKDYDDVRASTSVVASTSDNVLNAFPEASSALPNQATFAFSFTIPKSNPNNGPVAFGLIFGDYDVEPAEVDISGPNVPGGMLTIPLTKQVNPGQNGLIQLAQTVLPFNWVFSDGGGSWVGSLTAVVVNAPLEPYYAVDAVVLIGTQIPEPGTFALFGLGALGLLAWRRRRPVC